MNFSIINIIDFINSVDKDFVQSVFNNFSCPKNPEIEDFIRTKVVDFALKKISVTYLLVDDEKKLSLIFL